MLTRRCPVEDDRPKLLLQQQRRVTNQWNRVQEGLGSSLTVLQEALEARPGKPIKLRIQPQLLVKRDTGYQRKIYYTPWPAKQWSVECNTVDELDRVHGLITGLLSWISVSGVEWVEGVLDRLTRAEVESPTRQDDRGREGGRQAGANPSSDTPR